MQKKKRNFSVFSMKYKIIIMLLIFSIVPVMTTGIASYRIAKEKLSNKLEITSKQTITEISRGIDYHIKGVNNLLDILAEDINIQEANNATYFEFAKTLINNVKKTDENIINIFVGTETGMFYIEPYTKLPEDFNHKDRGWYQVALQQKGETIVTEPYIDTASGNLVISLAKAVYNKGQLIGVVGIDLELATYSDELSHIKLGDSGYVYITSTDGMMITHPEHTYIGTDAVTKYEFWDDVSKNQSGFQEFKENGEDMFTTYTTSDMTGWKIVGIMNSSELNRDTKSINDVIQLVLLGTASSAVVLAILFTRPLGKNIRRLVKAMDSFASGDLSTRVKIKANDEFLLLGNKFNQMSDTISSLISEINEVSTQVLDSSIALSNVVEETSSSLTSVAKAVDDVSKGANEQAKSALDGVTSMNLLRNSINTIDYAAKSMEELAGRATTVTNNGLNLVEQLLDTSSKTKESTLVVSELVYETNDSMAQINAISDTIDDITSRTNLLALNASIEAARAGESGRGFSVVADEIRSLAEQSKLSTVQIKKIVDGITQKARLTVEAMDATNHNMEDQLTTVSETKSYFVQIMESVELLLKHSVGIKENTTTVVGNNNEVLDEMEHISAISEESASASEEVTASTEQISSTMDEIAKQAVLLRELSHELSTSMDTFKTQ